MISQIARLSRITLAALALIGVVALTLFALFGEKTLRTQVERRLAVALNRKVTVGGLSVNLAGRVVELRDVVIPGLPGSKRPSVIAPRIRLALSFRSLFTTRILLRGFELERPRISVQVFPDGSNDLPSLPTTAGSSSREVSIEKLIVRSGDLFLNDQQIPLELSWPNFEASLVADAKNLLKGEMSAGPGPMRFGDLPAQDAHFKVDVRFADSKMYIDRGSFNSAGTKLALVGEFDFQQEPKGELRFSGPFDLESFDRKVAGTGLDIKGIAQINAVLKVDGEKLGLTGNLQGPQASYGTVAVGAFSTGLWWDGSTVRLKGLTFEVFDGKAIFEVEAPENAAVHVAGIVNNLRAEPLLHWLFGFGTAGLGSRVSGPIDVSLPRGAPNLLSGTGDLQFVADPARGDPLSGRFPFKAVKGVVTMTAGHFEVPKTTVTLDGSIDAAKRLSLDVKLVSEDLAITDAYGVRLRAAAQAPNPQPLGFL